MQVPTRTVLTIVALGLFLMFSGAIGGGFLLGPIHRLGVGAAIVATGVVLWVKGSKRRE